MEALIRKLERQPRADVILELKTLDGEPDFAVLPFRQEARLLGVGLPMQKPTLIDLRTAGDKVIPLVQYLEHRQIIGYNLQSKLGILRHQFAFKPLSVFCVMAASQILYMGSSTREQERRPSFPLCLKRHLGANWPSPPELSWGEDLTEAHCDLVCASMGQIPQLKQVCAKQLAQAGLSHVMDLEMAVMPRLIEMSWKGFPVNQALIEEIHQRELARVEELKALFRKQFGEHFNPNSDQQVRALLKRFFIDAPNAQEQTLKEIDHSVASLLYDYRVASKRLRAVDGLRSNIGRTGRTHCIFDPLCARTGRIQTKSFNLQGIPGEVEIRSCFVAEPGNVLLSWDYSTEELRILARWTGDQKLIDAFKEGRDLHVQTAAEILAIGPGEVNASQRAKGKSVNFGVVYGQGAEALAQSLGVSEAEAEVFIERFFDAHDGVRRHKLASWARSGGDVEEVRTGFGRRRVVPIEESDWERFVAFFNTPVQGTAADAMKLLLQSLDLNGSNGVELLATIHDAILVQCPLDRALIAEVSREVELRMEEVMRKLCPSVPFPVDVKIGPAWANMVPLEDFYWDRGNYAANTLQGSLYTPYIG